MSRQTVSISEMYTNVPSQDKETYMEMTSEVAEAIQHHRLEGFLEESGRGAFKIPVADLARFPTEVAKAVNLVHAVH